MLFPIELLKDVSVRPDGATASAIFPSSWPLLEGHFPGDPVVPAFVLVGLVRATAERAAGHSVEVSRCDRVKLTRPVRPGEVVRCELVLEREVGGPLRARALLYAADESAGSLVLSFAEGRSR